MSYPGGKNGAGVYQTIINLMPPHEVYIEPFLGGAAVMRAKRPARVNIGVDRDLAALEAARVDILADVGGATRVPAETAMLPAGSLGLAVTAAIADLGDARSLLADFGGECRQGASHLVMPDPVGGHSGASEFRLYCGDGIRFLRSYPFNGRELVYCDPPYVRSARSSPRDLYRYEMSDVDHRRLVRLLKALPCLAIVSGYWSALYADELRGWNHVTYQSPTRGGHMATEWLWFNFAEPVELHDYHYLGRNFRERERIKRKKQRWVGRLAKMPLLERQALLAAIVETAGRGLGAEPPIQESSLLVFGDRRAAVASNAGAGEVTRFGASAHAGIDEASSFRVTVAAGSATPRDFFVPANAERGSGKIFVTSQHGATR